MSLQQLSASHLCYMAEVLADICLKQSVQRPGLQLVSQNIGAAFLPWAAKAEGKVSLEG